MNIETSRKLRNTASCLFAASLFTATTLAAQPRPPDTIAQRVAACEVCHGKEGRATNEGYYPRIAGKPAGYLYNQLVNFRDGHRRNEAMIYLVDNLPDTYLREMAEYFARQKIPYPPPQASNATQATLNMGRELVMRGDERRKIPACISCHGKALTGVMPATPGLLGLPHAYLYAQLGSWKIGARHAAAPDCMEKITKELTMDDVGAVSAYLASLPLPQNAVPAAFAPVKPPIECGSFPPKKSIP